MFKKFDDWYVKKATPKQVRLVMAVTLAWVPISLLQYFYSEPGLLTHVLTKISTGSFFLMFMFLIVRGLGGSK